ncbi:MAG TPA: diaminopimelate decarboxylase, partial [Burkholderiales bacterium]
MAFAYRNGMLCAEQAPLDELARRFGTPCYVYSRAAIESAYAEFVRALAGRDAMLCYSVKANSNLAVLALLAELGAGFDIVSGGELARVLAAGGTAGKTFFSGVGKSAAEIEFALAKGIGCINLESEAELERVARIAQRFGRKAPVALRVNPDIDARTHPYISTGLRETKFGVAYADAERLYQRAAGMAELEVVGIGCHIGSLLNDAAPFVAAAQRLVELVDRLETAGVRLRHIDLGGGMGIRYKDEAPQPIEAFVRGALAALGQRPHAVVFDPGRSIVGNAGVLLTRVEYVKAGATRNFLVVDAAMNDLIRAPLYGAWHEIRTVREMEAGASAAVYDVVGPVCESADFLAKERRL